MMIDFDMIWDLLLKRQRELGEFHPDLPSSQGPIVGYHGRNFSIRHDNPGFSDRYQDAVRGERYSHEKRNEMLDRGESPFQTAEEFFDEERARVDREKSDQIAREGILPNDQSESQIGSGRWTQDPYTEELTFHSDIEPNVSVASEVETAMSYARGMSGYKDSSGNPALYGVRAGAMDRLQDMDEPRRRYGTLSQYVSGDGSQGDKDAAQFRFITGGLRPNELTRIPIDQAKEFAHGRREDWNRGIDDRFVPSRFESHGPDKIWRQNYTDKFDMDDQEGSWANAHPAAGAQQDWINSQVQAWRDKNEAMRRGKEERSELERKNREDEERVPQARLDDFGKSFDYVWAMITKELVTCPMCGEEGLGSWFHNHYPECAKRYMNENATGFDIVPNPDKAMGDAWRALDAPDEFMDVMEQREQKDFTNDFIAKPQFGGISREMSDKLQDAQERAMISGMYESGVLGRHPDQSVVQDDTTRRVGLWMNNDYGLSSMMREWVEERFDTGDLDHVGFGDMMSELLQGTSVHDELIDNERTWDDVDWHSIIDDEHQAQIDDFYQGLATGEYHHDDETLESDDWLWRDHYIDDDEHVKRLEDARRLEEMRRKRREER